ncbi:MAG: AraC family transcriptional regulator, partial [Actinomycetota bacterium]|nr:AraC family transcriptional regulator [Actinomycetota bacterium]
RRVVAAVRASVPEARTPVGVVVVRHPQHEDVAELVDLACRHHSGDGPMLTAFWAAGSSPAEALAPLEPYLLEPSLRLLGRPGRAVPAPDLPGQLVSRYCAGIDAVFEAVHLADEVRYRAAVEKLRTLGASWPRELRLADVASFTSARLGYAVQWSHPRAFLDQLTAFAPRVGKRSSSPAASRIGRIQEHLAENFAEPLSLASVAKRFDLTPTYLSALFHAKTGKTFLAYLTELRISYARQVLESDPEVQVRELAALSGYTSVRHFSQVFRRLTGSYPSKYLEELAGGDAAGRPTSEISSDDPLQVER